MHEDFHSRAGKGDLEFVSFWVDEQEYCVDIISVREIRGWTAATPLPQTPPYMRGVINLRGTVLPIVDFKHRLGGARATPSARNVIVVAHIGARLVGLLVDAVSDILTIPKDLIQPTPDIACEAVKSFVRGIVAVDGRMISVVALDRLLPEMDLEAA